MAGGSLITLLDDIASVLDDVAVLTKLAAKKTAGVLGDDLALNAQQVAGVAADRELPVVWAVAKGSALNKAILVPAALAITAFVPWLVVPLLMFGGAFLCYEGFEKVLHKLTHKAEEKAEHEAHVALVKDPTVDVVAMEKNKIRGAIRTDFILSAEIIVISLGTVVSVTFLTQVAVLVAVAVAMTIGVYGLVAGIVKLDDLGLYFSKKGGVLKVVGRGLLAGAPWLMKGLAIAGTAAMFLVGGGIVVHDVPPLEHLSHDLTEGAGSAGFVVSTLFNLLVGVLIGGLALGLVKSVKWLLPKRQATTS